MLRDCKYSLHSRCIYHATTTNVREVSFLKKARCFTSGHIWSTLWKWVSNKCAGFLISFVIGGKKMKIQYQVTLSPANMPGVDTILSTFQKMVVTCGHEKNGKQTWRRLTWWCFHKCKAQKQAHLHCISKTIYHIMVDTVSCF